MNASLERRVRQLRSRRLVRAWEYRQRRHARGVWFRLRRVLADARAAYIIPCSEARTLVAEGYQPEPVGAGFEPPKLIVFAPAERIARIPLARAVDVRLSAELLSAECLALTPFEVPSLHP
jgi:hypothetical protein